MPGVIVHEWIEESGGAEKVLDSFGKIFPEAPIYCLWSDAEERYAPGRVRQSWLAKTALRRRKAAALPFMPLTWRLARAGTDPDWILVSSHLFAHHVSFARASKDTPKLVYAHTPARYIWTPELDERGNSIPARVVSPILKTLDRSRIREATSVAANSKFIAARIQNTWECDAQVIYPPVDVETIQSVDDWSQHLTTEEAEVLHRIPIDYILGASRLVPYKRMEEVIRVGDAINLPVVIVGEGPEQSKLRAIAEEARVPVFFLGRVSNSLLYSLYERTSLFVFPPVEDFGIVPVEAMSAGASVLANRVGGASESVLESVTGALTSFEDMSETVKNAERAIACQSYESRIRAQTFSEREFVAEISKWVSLHTNNIDVSAR